MRRVAIFGNAGGGKSTLARELGKRTGLPVFPLDQMKYRSGGGEIPYEEYLDLHRQMIQQEAWIIDGFGCITTVWERLAEADTLVHVDLPLWKHGFWVTKRLMKGLFVDPEGWPENSPIISGSIQSYKVLWPCHSKLSPKYRAYCDQVSAEKSVVRIQNGKDVKALLARAKLEGVQPEPEAVHENSLDLNP